MKHIQLYENFASDNSKKNKNVSEIILESFDEILQHSIFLNEIKTEFDPETFTNRIVSLSRGEKIAQSREQQILEDDQLFGAYLRALDEFTENNFIEKIPGINNFKRKNKNEKISDLDLAIALNYDRLATFLLDKNKFISLLKGDYSFASQEIDKKRLEIFQLLQGFDPEEIIQSVSRLIQNTSLPRILKKEKYQDPLIQKNIFMWVQDTIDQLKINRTSGMFKTYPGNQKWQSDMAQVINNAAKRFNKESDEILAIYQDEKSKREKSMSSMRGRPARKY
jgi:hypothetical protein